MPWRQSIQSTDINDLHNMLLNWEVRFDKIESIVFDLSDIHVRTKTISKKIFSSLNPYRILNALFLM